MTKKFRQTKQKDECEAKKSEKSESVCEQDQFYPDSTFSPVRTFKPIRSVEKEEDVEEKTPGPFTTPTKPYHVAPYYNREALNFSYRSETLTPNTLPPSTPPSSFARPPMAHTFSPHSGVGKLREFNVLILKKLVRIKKTNFIKNQSEIKYLNVLLD